jgi:hypothetical protein
MRYHLSEARLTETEQVHTPVLTTCRETNEDQPHHAKSSSSKSSKSVKSSASARELARLQPYLTDAKKKRVNKENFCGLNHYNLGWTTQRTLKNAIYQQNLELRRRDIKSNAKQ